MRLCLTLGQWIRYGGAAFLPVLFTAFFLENIMIHKILIVDDEKENLLALQRTLRQLAEIYMADSAKKALSILDTEKISIIITDQRMPEMSGVELLKKVYREHPTIVRIILTGYTDIEDLIQAINAAHIYRYLTKPWNNEELKFIVKQAMERFELQNENIELNQDLKIKNLELHEKENELKHINKSLEKKIHDRTRDLERLNQKLNKLAVTDELTDIGNHRLFQTSFETELHRAQRYARNLSLLIVDVDHFKIYNDTYGHSEGDKILKALAGLLEKTTRKEDIVTRYGGEEFAIIAPETSKKKAEELAERIRKAVDDEKLHITVSIGLATFPEDGKSLKEVFKKADKALYQAKKLGRNLVSVWNQKKKVKSQ